MLTAIKTFLSVPNLYPHANRRAAQTLNMMLLIQGVVVAGIILVFLFTTPGFAIRPTFIAISLDLFIYIVAKLFLNRGQLRASGIMMIVVQAFNLAGIIFLESGIRDLKTAAFIGLIAMSSLILNRKDTIFVGILTIFISTIIFLAELLGIRQYAVADNAVFADLAVLLSVIAVMILVMTQATRAINHAFASIQANETRIRHDNKLLEDEIEVHAAAERALTTLNRDLAATQKGLEASVLKRTQALARANSDLETLLQVTSLDLKEPLFTIRKGLALALEDQDNELSDKAADYLNRVVRAADRMDILLNDVITLSQVQKLENLATETDLNLIVDTIKERLEGQIEETQASIKVDGRLAKLNVDPLWVSEAIFNLVSNALKYCVPGEKPNIEIANFQDDSGSGVIVQDRGPGVPEEYRERIFELFKRAVNREIAGTGAGLAIVQQIAKRHGGRAWVESRPGGGSRFYVTFGPAAEVQGT